MQALERRIEAFFPRKHQLVIGLLGGYCALWSAYRIYNPAVEKLPVAPAPVVRPKKLKKGKNAFGIDPFNIDNPEPWFAKPSNIDNLIKRLETPGELEKMLE